MKLLFVLFFSLFLISEIDLSLSMSNGVEPNLVATCEPGIKYIENACKECRCIEPGTVECVGHFADCKSEKSQKLNNCTPGPIYDDDCNLCQCLKYVGTFCTGQSCKPGKPPGPNDLPNDLPNHIPVS